MKKTIKRTLSIFLCFVLMLTYLPGLSLAAADEDTRILNIVEGSKKADAPTLEKWKDFFGPDKMDTEHAGSVWTDKSVFTEESDLLPGVDLKDDKNFLVALSALSSTLAIKGYESSPTDVMIVLDVSGSMVNTEMVVGYERDRDEVKGRDMSEVTAMVDATNATIKRLMEQNGNNRVGVVLFSGNSSTSEVGKTSHATVVLPLNRYTANNDKYLEIDTTWTTTTLYDQNGKNGKDTSYVKTNTAVHVRTVSGVRVENGSTVKQVTKQVVGGTYTQNALSHAMSQFLAVEDTTVPAGRPQAGAERMPVLVLMTDGSPTLATPSYSNIGDSSVGNGAEPSGRTGLTSNQKTQLTDSLAFLTQLTAAHVRRQVTEHYKETAQDNEDFLFLTLGLGTENMNAATQTLDPRNSSNTVKTYWQNFLSKNTGSSISITTGSDGNKNVTRRAGITAADQIYVDRYYYADDAQTLINSFDEIFKEIVLKSGSYATLVEGNANYSGYITFEDELGELMHVTDMKGVLMDNGKGGTVLYTGRGVAEGTANGQLGTAGGFTERGQEYINTICERIPGITLSQAQSLIVSAMQDQQLYYEDADSWSNYIGWYADADGNYTGFWDKDSGYENAPAGARYANKSYAYLGVEGSSDMMHVIVLVQTDLTTLHQTVKMKIPAALLPTVRYEVEIDEDDPDKVLSFERQDALPMQLVFELGLRPDINSVNMEQKIAEHLQRGGHVHRLPDGTVELFSNSWAIGNDKNQNGYPDPEEVETAVVAESHFQPAKDNSHYYYLEDTPVLDKNGNVITGHTRPTEGYYDRYIYNETERTAIQMPMAEDTLENKAVYKPSTNSWYIPAGTMIKEHSHFRLYKEPNITGTLDYHEAPAAFENGDKQDIYDFLGNNGTYRLAPASGIVLEKKIQGDVTEDTFTFEISLSNIPQGATADPVVTDANGDPLGGVTVTPYAGGKFTVTLPTDVKAYISGIPVGTTVQVAEKIDGDYKVAAIQVAGQNQPATGPATATIPAYTPNGNQMVPVVFTNAPNGYGDLLVSKEVLHNLPSTPAALQDKVFTLNIALTGDKVERGDTFATSLNKKVKVGANGVLTFENGDPITLHHAESLTILDLPEGTGYTVSESDIPDGFALDTINGQTVTSVGGTIAADDVATVAVVNIYDTDFDPVEADMTVTVNKDLTGTPATPETFRFVLEKLNATGGYDPVQTFSVRSDAANKVDSKTLPLSFDKIGEYSYRIMEQIPANPTPGMTYATTRSLFTIVVTDTDMDGKLEVAVREEANVSARAIYTDANNAETIENIAVEATFANRYAVHSTNVSIPVQKILDNETGVNIPLTEFKFGLYAVDANNRPVGEPIQTVTAGALGQATFNLHITEDKDLTYVIQEIVPATKRPGMTYDDTLYLVEIDVSVGQNDQLVAVATTTPVGGTDPAAVTFTNTYKLTPTEAYVPFVKRFSGRKLTDNERFRFELVRTDSAYQKLTGADAYTAYYYKGADAMGMTTQIKLGDKTEADSMLNKAGTYYFKLTEIDGGLPGITYDKSEYHIQIEVTDNGRGALTATTTIRKLGQADPVDSAAFVNEYTVTGSETLTFQGVKAMTGRVPNPNEFEVGLYSDSDCTDLLDTAVVRADGSFTFAFTPITYTPDHLGTDNAQKIYTYYVKEIDTDKPGVTYDATVHTITVTVDHKDGQLIATPSDNADKLVITNRYDAKPVSVSIPGRKTLSGDWSAVTNKTFTFELLETNSEFVIIDTQPVATATVNGADTFEMTLTYEDGDEGPHYYLLREDLSNMRPGINPDAGSYHVTVEVTDPALGQLTGRVSMVRSGSSGAAEEALFDNEYSVQPTNLTLEGSKVFTDLSTQQAKAMTDGRFTFRVLENGTQVATGKSRADGTIAFDAIEYTEAGVHTYTVVEDNPNADDGVSYDDTVFTVTVTVTDNGDGTLTATPNYNNTPVAFENFYNPDPVTYDLTAKKVYEKGTLTADKFTFTLSGDTITTQEKKNDADGNVVFDRLTFTKTGTYTFTVEETHNLLWGFIQWDTNVYTVTITVTDDHKGNLVIEQDAVTITSDKGRNDLTFVNIYTVDGSESVVIRGTKTLDGRAINQGEFSVGLYSDAACTDLLDTAVVNADGTFAFGAITFTEDDLGADYADAAYTYYVKEIDGHLPGITYDTTVHTITVTVSHEEGALVVTPSQNVTNIQVVNAYEVAPTEIILEGTKTFVDQSTNQPKAMTDGRFTFVVKENGQKVAEGVSKADGTIVFDAIEYTKAGTHTYTVEEVDPAVDDGVSYDDTVFTVTVTVIDNGDGTLTATPDYNNTPVVFENFYNPDPVTYTITAKKEYPGGTLEADQFTFTLTGEDIATQEKKNDADGNVVFDDLTFTKTGTYTYTVKESVDLLWNTVQWDTNVYTVTITVTDDQAGNLVIEDGAVTIASDKGRNDLTFVNIHKEGVLEKDVFAPSAPTVSIDGTQVKVGSELLYAVTYHNRNGAAVDVTITDIIPEHTTYVDGSADNGGTYADGILTWTAHVEMGGSLTVTFRVTVDDYDVTILNQATAVDGFNDLISNETVNTTPIEEIPDDPDTPIQDEESPQTGDTSYLWLWLCLLFVSGSGMTLFGIADRRNCKSKH